MNPMVVLSAVIAAAAGAPADLAVAAPGYGVAPVGYAGYAAAPLVAAAPAVVPGPIVKEHIAGPPAISRAQAPITQSKQVHYGQTTYVAGYASEILKPAVPEVPIAVPTILRQNVQVNPAIVKTVNEIHTVNEPNPVDAPYNAPFDAPYQTTRIVKVPTPVHVDAPYGVDAPYHVQGEPIVNVRQQNVHRHFHTQSASVAQPALAVAAPAVAQVGYASAPAAAIGYGAAPAALGYANAGYANAGIANVGIAGAPVAAVAGHY